MILKNMNFLRHFQYFYQYHSYSFSIQRQCTSRLASPFQPIRQYLPTKDAICHTCPIVQQTNLICFHHSRSGLRHLSHRSTGKSSDIKKCRAKLRALSKSTHQELQNEPAHDIAVRLPQNPFLASLWIGSGLGDPEAGQKGILG